MSSFMGYRAPDGRPYYFRADTRESVWELPAGVSQVTEVDSSGWWRVSSAPLPTLEREDKRDATASAAPDPGQQHPPKQSEESGRARMPRTPPPQAAGVRPASETPGSAAPPAEGKRSKKLLLSPFDVPTIEWFWHVDTQQWHIGPPKPGWPVGWYFSWTSQKHVQWRDSPGPALGSPPSTPLSDAFLASAGGLEEKLQRVVRATDAADTVSTAPPESSSSSHRGASADGRGASGPRSSTAGRGAAEARADTGSAAQPADSSPAQAESDTVALHEIIRLLWRGHAPQRVTRVGGAVHVVAEEVGGRERMERLLALAATRRQPGVDARQQKLRRAGQHPLPNEAIVLDKNEVDLCIQAWRDDFLANELNDQDTLRRPQEDAQRKVRRAKQALHQFCRTRFQAHLFHVSGNIHVLRCMVAHPCSSADDLLKLARGWARTVQSPEYLSSVSDSTKKTAHQAMVREAARQARRRHAAAIHILQQLRRGRLRKEALDPGRRELVEQEESGELKRRLDEANDLYAFGRAEDRHAGTSRLLLRDVFGDR